MSTVSISILWNHPHTPSMSARIRAQQYFQDTGDHGRNQLLSQPLLNPSLLETKPSVPFCRTPTEKYLPCDPARFKGEITMGAGPARSQASLDEEPEFSSLIFSHRCCCPNVMFPGWFHRAPDHLLTLRLKSHIW